MQVESFSQQPLAQAVAAYLYDEYSDDSDLQAFIAAYNALAQGYIDWFNTTPLGFYTSPNITGQLLDWTAEGIYGIKRPVISSLLTRTIGSMNSQPMNVVAMNQHTILRGGTAQVASDDIYKRVLTWILYRGDGMQSSIIWLRKRVARFIYGANGSDVPLSDTLNVGIIRPNLPAVGALNSIPMNTRAMNTRASRNKMAAHTLEIVLPSSTISQQFVNLLQQGYLPVPFQVTFRVALT